MSQMTYFRRPQLSGTNLPRLLKGKVRGDSRRLDPDGVSAVPYFPSVSGGTLLITTDLGAFPVNLTSNAYDQILSDIRTALGASGIVSDEDGCIAIETVTDGSTGFVEVTGGSASVTLGFNTYGGALPIISRGADVASAPEGRTGNPFGAAFPAYRENLSREALARSFGRLSANQDVLWVDHTKDQIAIQVVPFTADVSGGFLSPTVATTRLFVGGGLSNASGKSALLPYFQLVDTATGLAAQSQVVAVVRGSPVGEPPYLDSPSWTDTTGKNILGQDQTKVSSAITLITDGRFVTCAGATFQSSGVVPGDYVEISASTNTSPWSNNGNRWIVESVLSETELAVRPMSKSELDTAGTVVTDNQPILELNDYLPGGGSYGTLTVRTGPFAHNVTLVVRPPIPSGASYELRAAVASSSRDYRAHSPQFGASSALLDLSAPYSPNHNGIISGLVATLAAPNCAVTAGLIRWRGRTYAIPAKTFVPGDFANGVNYVYWDDSTTSLAVTASASAFGSLYDPSVTTNKGHLVAKVTVTAGNITSVVAVKRLIADAGRSVTVGAGGQFPTLGDALNYLSLFSSAFAEGASASGSFPHVEIVLVSNTTYDNASVVLSLPSITIRGASKNIVLTCASGILLDSTRQFELRDLTVVGPGFDSLVQPLNGAVPSSIRLVNVSMSSGFFANAVGSNGTSTVSSVLIDSCDLTLSSGVVRADHEVGAGTVVLLNSTFTGNTVFNPVFVSDYGVATWGGKNLSILGCKFLGGWATSSAIGAMCVEATDAASQVIVRDTQFDIGIMSGTTGGAILFTLTGNGLVENCRTTTGRMPKIINGALAIVSRCSFSVNTEGTTASIVANAVLGTTLTHVDTSSNVLGGTGIQAAGTSPLIQGNRISGPFTTAIDTSTIDGVVVAENTIVASFISFAKPLTGISIGVSDKVVVVNNIIGLTASTLNWVGIGVPGGTPTYYTVQGNKVTFPEPTALNVIVYGISLRGTGGNISQNSIRTTTAGVPDASQSVYGLAITGSLHNIVGNSVVLNASGAGPLWIGLSGTGQHFRFAENFLSVFGMPLSMTNPDAEFIGNTFEITTSQVIPTGHSNKLTGKVIGNRFTTTSIGHTVAIADGVFTGNDFVGNVRLESALNVVFSGNRVSGAFDGVSATPSITTFSAADNYVTSTFKITNISAVADVTFNGNYVVGQASFVLGGGEVSATGNVTDSFVADLGTASASSVSYAGNKTMANNVYLTATRVEVTGNDIATGLDVLEGYTLPGTFSSISGNRIGTTLTTYSKDITVDGNSVGSTWIHTRTTGSGLDLGSRVTAMSNFFGGYVSISSQSGGVPLQASVSFSNNVVNAATGSCVFYASSCVVDTNLFLSSNSPDVQVGGTQIWVRGNNIQSTVSGVGTNGNTRLWLFTAAADAVVEGNYVYGRVQIGTGGTSQSIQRFIFSRNFVYYLGANNAVVCGSIGDSGAGGLFQYAIIEGNQIELDLSSQTAVAYAPFLFNSATSPTVSGRITFANNLVSVVNSVTPPTTTVGLIDSVSGTTCHDIIFTGNHLYKPTDGTVTWDFVRLQGATDIEVVGNLMYTGGTIAAAGAGRRGDNAYTASGAPYVITQ